MTDSYFRRVAEQTDTRLWINNPTGEEISEAIAAGAVSCTTNPSYCARLLDGEPDYVRDLVASVVEETDDESVAAEMVYQSAATRVIAAFLPIYDRSGGTAGFVTIQGDPRRDDDPDYIVAEALRHRRLGPNFMSKIPVTEAGTSAIAALVAENIPLCATEVFALAQASYVCGAYQRAARQTGNHPPFYVTHITGIFDQYLADYVRREGVQISPEALAWAGCAIAHQEYRLLKNGNYPGIMLGGGARGTQHFTEMVGGDMHITINWSTALTLIEANPPVVSRVDVLPLKAIADELLEKLPDFRKAYLEDGLAPAEFKDFGPLVLFRGMFLKGYSRLIDAVRAGR